FQPDAVIYATGFRPALHHLASLALALDAQSGRPQLDGLESVSAPDLFFIGLDHGRNFQSRFIRGIRNDAVVLAERLEQRLRSPVQPGPGARTALSGHPLPPDPFAGTGCLRSSVAAA